ncbi:hypothetical protein D3C81_1718950 [compost metagenome]
MSKVSRGISMAFLQWLHSLRARRWAMIRLTEVAMLKPGIPMLCRRVRVSAALLVCRVESTR